MVFIDQEGGRVTRLKVSRGFEPLPSAADFASMDFEEAKAIVGTTCSNALEEAMNVFDGARVVFISPSATADHLSQAGLATFNRTAFPERILPSSESFAADLGNPAYQDFVAAFEAAYGRPCCEPYAAEAYDAAAILLTAIEQVAVFDDACDGLGNVHAVRSPGCGACEFRKLRRSSWPCCVMMDSG